MCALFPPFFPSYGWPLENPISDQQDYTYKDAGSIELGSLEFRSVAELDRAASLSVNNSGDPAMVKKLHHNASERHRRKNINALYSSLRSLLPAADQTKKLSIPAIVSRALKYIPELQQQVERLIQKKEELSIKISKQGDIIHQKQQRKIASGGSSLASINISASRLSDMEILIQIVSYKDHKYPLSSEILLNLEEDGLLLLNASSFESFDGRVFYNLNLQVEITCGWNCDILSEKLKSLYAEKLFPSNFGRIMMEQEELQSCLFTETMTTAYR